MVSDIEKLRNFLAIERWLVFGGSWGSTLGLVYGETHPERCIGFILRGIFLGEQREIDWFINGMGNFFPEAKQRFLSILSEKEKKNPLFSYLERLQDPNPAVQSQAARAWSIYEQSCSTLRPADSLSLNFSNVDDQLSLARLSTLFCK